MTLRVILARLTGTSLDDPVMDGAFALASATSEGHIHAFIVRPDPRLTLPSPNEAGMSPGLYDSIFESMERSGLKKASVVRAKFEGWCTAHGVNMQERAIVPLSADFTDFIGLESAILAEEAKLADITVMALEGATLDEAALGAVLIDSGRPVMFVPSGNKPLSKLSSILVAWNDSPEAVRAVSAAIPLMRKAKKVTVITVADGPLQENSADRLANYLLEEGVHASVIRRESPSEMAVERRLLAAVQITEAELIVMGAYSHSRAREMIFGGVTRHLLHHSPIGIFMSH